MDDTITFEVTAIIVDDAAALAGATLTNTASLTVTPKARLRLIRKLTLPTLILSNLN